MILVNIQDDIIRLQSMRLLDKLLVDKTTHKNIMWATDAYDDLGAAYKRNEQIFASLITNNNLGVIKTRARKEFEQQSKRTRQRAEVFTPLWTCNLMLNSIDEQWFGRKNVFNIDGIPTDKIVFDEGLSWKEYVDSTRLEITCGEAPYLVSRYDVESGELINILNRVGILDRKIRVVTENTTSYEEWISWVIRAYQATYGYEFQGDNLLISRVNLLMTFIEYCEYCWHRLPDLKSLKAIVNVITWNIWQMDGITGTIPFKKARDQYYQMDLFSFMGWNSECDESEVDYQPLCRIFDWKHNRSLIFKNVKET